MDWLQTLLDNSSTPVLTAFLLGLLTALSPCPLATNIAAIGFIGKDIENRKRVFRNGLLYTLGRILSYTLLGAVLIMVLKEGSSMFGIQKAIGTWGGTCAGSASARDRSVHAFWRQTESPAVRLPRKCGRSRPERRMGGPADWCTVCPGFLSDKRRVLFRHADTDVCHSDSRLFPSCGICHCHSHPCACRGMDSCLQCAADGKFLRQDVEGAEMDEPDCGRGVYPRRHLLLLDNVFIKRINNKPNIYEHGN